MNIVISESQYKLLLEENNELFKRVKLPYDYSDLKEFVGPETMWEHYNRHYKGYTGRNPKTGATITVPDKRLPFFKPGKDLTDRINK